MLAFQEWMELGGKVKEGEHSLRIKGYQLRLFHNSQTRGAQGEPPEDAGEGRLTSSQGGRPSRSPLNSPCKCGADQTRPVPFISNCVGKLYELLPEPKSPSRLDLQAHNHWNARHVSDQSGKSAG
jgi:hypothetical protein